MQIDRFLPQLYLWLFSLCCVEGEVMDGLKMETWPADMPYHEDPFCHTFEQTNQV
jgi:hypothetical protein